MKYLYPAAAFVLFIFFVSCDNKAESNKESLAAPVLPLSTAVPVTTNPVATNPVVPANNDTSTAVKNGAAALKADVALNPQHGQPGHRCDIAVGAPLNSPATTIKPNVPAITPPTSTATANTSTVAQKAVPLTDSLGRALNPKHGEPGHRCDIAVGALLNSKPAQ